jgi:PAS domain S-box-containing protein
MKISQSLSKETLGDIVDALIENSFDSVMVTEAGNGASTNPIVFVNEAFTALTGYTAEDVMGKSPTMLQGSDTDPAVIERLREDMGAGRSFEGETTNYRKDGTPFTMHWRVAPVEQAAEQAKYHIAVQRRES